MFKKTITFEDFNGVEHTKDFYFHIPSPEVTAWLQPGSEFMQRLDRVQKSDQVTQVLAFYKDIITQACGVRSEDGMRFIQTPEAKSELIDSPALDELLLELMLNPAGPFNFLKNLLPKKILDKVGDDIEQAIKELGLEIGVIEAPVDNRPAWEKEGRKPTTAEFKKLSPEERQEVYANFLGTK
jgi:hypothetical protein